MARQADSGRASVLPRGVRTVATALMIAAAVPSGRGAAPTVEAVPALAAAPTPAALMSGSGSMVTSELGHGGPAPVRDPGAERPDRGGTEEEATPPEQRRTEQRRTTTAAAEPEARAAPVAIRLAGITEGAPLVPVGVEPDGQMEVPHDVRTVGWYDPGPGAGVIPGAPGTAVLAGHVSSRAQGAGAFHRLDAVTAGSAVEVTHADGSVTRWTVTEVVRYSKTDIPLDELFVWDGPPRLALVTCGGRFDRVVGSHTDNIVVLARPELDAQVSSLLR